MSDDGETQRPGVLRRLLVRFDKFETRSLLAVMLVASVLALMFVLGVRNPESDAFKILLGGVMTVGFASVIGWYFGSSSGSAMKDEALARTSQAQTETIAAQSQALAASAPTTPAAPGPEAPSQGRS